MPEQKNEQGGNQQQGGTSTIEWIAAGISAVLVLGIIGFMLYEAFSQQPTPPKIEIEIGQIVDTGNGYVVDFWAHNRGHSTAAALVVEGELRSDTGVIETASTTLDYVPSEAKRQAGLFFSNNPDSFSLDVSPKGYDVP